MTEDEHFLEQYITAMRALALLGALAPSAFAACRILRGEPPPDPGSDAERFEQLARTVIDAEWRSQNRGDQIATVITAFETAAQVRADGRMDYRRILFMTLLNHLGPAAADLDHVRVVGGASGVELEFSASWLEGHAELLDVWKDKAGGPTSRPGKDTVLRRLFVRLGLDTPEEADASGRQVRKDSYRKRREHAEEGLKSLMSSPWVLAAADPEQLRIWKEVFEPLVAAPPKIDQPSTEVPTRE